MRFLQAAAAALSLLGAQAADADVRQIAIIGAGAAGASTAYHVRQFAEAAGVAVNITLLEGTDRIGGRTLTVAAFDEADGGLQVELGASIFVRANSILWEASETCGLERMPAFSSDDADGIDDDDGGGGDNDVTGVWDGDAFVFRQDGRAAGWWNTARLVWRYGLAPYRTQRLMQGAIERFLRLYEAPAFPFRSLTARVHELGLAEATDRTGAAYLAQHGVGDGFAHDVVQAATRVNYAANLERIHALDTMVALAPAGASQIRGGNWQLFACMAQMSGAVVRTETAVVGIERAEGDGGYVLKTKRTKTGMTETKTAMTAADAAADADTDTDTDADTDADTDTTDPFDAVVIAAPFQFSGIAAADVLPTGIDAVAYVRLHVTLLTSPLRLSAAFFGLPADAVVPASVLTTLAAGDNATSGHAGVGKPGFFSVSLLRRAVNPATRRREFLYKIFSPDPVTPAFLSALLAADVPDTVTGPASPVSWFLPHVFHSYPEARPRVVFQDPVVGDRLYYTAGIETFISTMETSALMGKNVARLLVDDLQGQADADTDADADADAATAQADEL